MTPLDLLFLAIALVVILFGAELFTNGIEWFGHKLNLAEGAVGSVLAAVGTALPETMIPIVAIVSVAVSGADPAASHAGEEIGVGAILGAPFMLSTLAMFVTGVAVLTQARKRAAGDTMPVDANVLGKDIRYFFIAYAIAIGAAFVPPELNFLKLVAAGLLLVIYAIYVKAHFDAEASGETSDLAPLRFQRFDRRAPAADAHGAPRLRIVNFQVLAALGLILAGAVVFVDAVEHVATGLGVAPAILALVIAPIATELPEKFNSILWVRQGKDTLAMGNITGAMVFQSCIPTIVALVLAGNAWTFDRDSLVAFASAGIAFLSTAAIFLPMVRRGSLTGRSLLVGGVFYVAYLILVAASLAGLV
jgi:cation:H+ antiporter